MAAGKQLILYRMPGDTCTPMSPLKAASWLFYLTARSRESQFLSLDALVATALAEIRIPSSYYATVDDLCTKLLQQLETPSSVRCWGCLYVRYNDVGCGLR